MLAKMPQKTSKSPFRNKLTIISLVLLMGLGLSAAYFTVPFLQVPIPAPDNLVANATNTTVSGPVSHVGASTVKVQTPQANATQTTNTTTNNVNTPNINMNNNTSKYDTNTKTSKTNNSNTSNTSKTIPTKTTKSSTNIKSNNST